MCFRRLDGCQCWFRDWGRPCHIQFSPPSPIIIITNLLSPLLSSILRDLSFSSLSLFLLLPSSFHNKIRTRKSRKQRKTDMSRRKKKQEKHGNPKTKLQASLRLIPSRFPVHPATLGSIHSQPPPTGEECLGALFQGWKGCLCLVF